MNISATIKSSHNKHAVTVQTKDDSKTIDIAVKSNGYGSSINGGELLLLSLATCFCNDLYREAAKRKIIIDSVEVACRGEFGAEGEAGTNFTYKTHISSPAPAKEIQDLVDFTDKIAEIHNTLRKGIDVQLIK